MCPRAASAGAERHRTPAFGAEANAGQQRGAAVLADVGGAGQDGVDLRQPPTSTVMGEETALVEISGDGLGSHRTRRAVTFKKQAIDQPHRVGA